MAGFATQYTLAIVIQEISRGRAISDAKQRLQGLGTTADKAGNQTLTAMEKLKRGIRGVASTIGRVLTPALALGGLAAANFAKDAALEYAKYEQTLREVYTLAPDLNEAAQEQIRGQIMTTGVEYGRLTEETIPALYQAISLGIPPDNAPAAVELAAKAATAGVAGLESTMVTGLTIMNAHKLGVEDLAHIYDVLQTMIRFGFIRMDEMNRVMGPLNKTAADSGTSLESVAAAMITLTRQGLDAAGAAELLNFLLLQLTCNRWNGRIQGISRSVRTRLQTIYCRRRNAGRSTYANARTRNSNRAKPNDDDRRRLQVLQRPTGGEGYNGANRPATRKPDRAIRKRSKRGGCSWYGV
jgi:hypothetical protein